MHLIMQNKILYTILYNRLKIFMLMEVNENLLALFIVLQNQKS